MSGYDLSESPRIGGTIVWYYYICNRQVWLMTRGIEPDRRDDALVLGRLVDEQSYRRDKHNVQLGDNRFDIVSDEQGVLVVGEVKKSSRSKEAARMQLAHYLYELQKKGLQAEGELLFPKERYRERLILDEKITESLENAYKNIREIALSLKPPALRKTRFCAKCAYKDWCWG